MKRIRSDISPLLGRFKRMLVERAGKYRDDGLVLLHKDMRPDAVPMCPKCGRETRWRGPNPEPFKDPPLVEGVKEGCKTVAVSSPRRDEVRESAAGRLYSVADKYEDGPQESAVAGYVFWQPEICNLCMGRHVMAWFDSMFPAKRSNKKGDDGKWGGLV